MHGDFFTGMFENSSNMYREEYLIFDHSGYKIFWLNGKKLWKKCFDLFVRYFLKN